MANFEKALKFTLKWEGGYSNDRDDRGGKTQSGVTQGTYNLYRKLKQLPLQDVQKIEPEEIKDVYYHLYWIPGSCLDFSDKVALAVFDFSVNSGVSRAIRYLQKILGIQVDGLCGPITKMALQNYIEEHGESEFLSKYLNSRENFFRVIGRGNQRKFLKGWLNRLNDLRNVVLN